MIRRIILKPFKIFAAAASLAGTFVKSTVLVIWSVTKIRRKKHKLDKTLHA